MTNNVTCLRGFCVRYLWLYTAQSLYTTSGNNNTHLQLFLYPKQVLVRQFNKIYTFFSFVNTDASHELPSCVYENGRECKYAGSTPNVIAYAHENAAFCQTQKLYVPHA